MGRVDKILDKLLIKACVHCDEPIEAEKGLREHKKMVAQAKRELLELLVKKIPKKKNKAYEEFGTQQEEFAYNQALDEVLATLTRLFESEEGK